MPRDLADFATGIHPMHPSWIYTVVQCPWRAAMEFLDATGDGEGGPAADTGSAMHKAAAAFHTGKGVSDALQVMRDNLKEYPAADLADAAGMFLTYAADPRNRDAKIILVEEPVAFTIAPHPEDKTKRPIEVEGVVDQVREDVEGLNVYDIKTSKKDPNYVRAISIFQQAAYCIGVAMKLKRPVVSAKLIMPRKYSGMDPGSAPVFWPYMWKFADIEQILLGLRIQVMNIRHGNVYHVPNDGCFWCRAKTPDVCLPELQQLNVRLRSESI